MWALVPHIPFLHALAVGACVTPTDPVLSNSIVKGYVSRCSVWYMGFVLMVLQQVCGQEYPEGAPEDHYRGVWGQ